MGNDNTVSGGQRGLPSNLSASNNSLHAQPQDTPRRSQSPSPLATSHVNVAPAVAPQSTASSSSRSLSDTAAATETAAVVPYEVKTNDPAFNQHRGYPNNYIRTTKYTLVTFLPLNLFEQFKRLSNIYFLVSMVVALIPGVSPVFPVTSIVPLVFVLTVGAIKDAVEDYDRYKADKEANAIPVKVLREGQVTDVKTSDVVVGDIVFMEKGQVFPADLLLLSSSSKEGQCYVETSNLDGETNLKLRKPVAETVQFDSPQKIGGLSLELSCEPPSVHLYKFHGRLIFPGPPETTVSLSERQLLLRGSQLRNTHWIYGLCVYAGTDTKMFKNLQKKPMKFSSVNRLLNRFVLALFILQQILCCIGGGLAVGFQTSTASQSWYLVGYNAFNSAQLFFTQWLTYFVLYNVMIPISLFVSLEIVRVCQAKLMEWDKQMHARGKKMIAKTSSLNDELARIEWVFSDKTGTLTENIMEFSRCCVDGHIHDEILCPGQLKEILRSPRMSEKAKGTMVEFLTALAVCHDVVPEVADNKMVYEAQSTDEVALVSFARNNGFELLSRSTEGVEVMCLGQKILFQVLTTLEFNADRKRMSVIVRRKDTGRLTMYTKGADTMILARLDAEQLDKYTLNVTQNALRDFGKEGLRTLLVGYRDLDEAEYQTWRKESFAPAEAALEGRDEKVNAACELIEKKLLLLGATAIEDKLQPEVPETIQYLLEAGMKVYILTGDKRETAVNIAHSSRLLTEDMEVLHVEADTSEKCGRQLQQYLDQFVGPPGSGRKHQKELAVVIDGASLHFALEDHSDDLLRLCLACHAAICCRITPLQKALMVRLICRRTNKIGLAIGDGANDVSMIMEAKVGVGIIGVEGTQAARSADYAIPQFRHLRRLLAVHGRYSFLRAGDLIQYSFYKNMLIMWCQFFFIFYNGYTGQTFFDSWILLFYNMLFTAFPPLFTGIFEKDLNEKLIDPNPQAYLHCQRGRSCTWLTFSRWLFNSLLHSVLIYFSLVYIYNTETIFPAGRTGGIWEMGTLASSIFIVVALVKSGMETRCWTWITHLGIWGSLILYFVFLFVYCALSSLFGQANMYFVIYNLMASGMFWVILIWGVGSCLMMDLLYKYVQWHYFPYDWQMLQTLYKQFGVIHWRSSQLTGSAGSAIGDPHGSSGRAMMAMTSISSPTQPLHHQDHLQQP